MNISDVIEKVKKLQRLATSSNPNEAAAAAAAANKLIDQYRIQESELEVNSEVCEDIIQDPEAVYESGRITQWKTSLVCYLSKHYGCAIFNFKGFRSSSYRLIGRKSDVEVVKYMFAWLCVEIERLCNAASKSKSLGRSSGKIFANSFCAGAVAGIREQLEASRKEVASTSNSTAVVKLNQRYDEAVNFMNSKMNLRKVSNQSKSYLDRSAYENGKVKGSSIHLGSGLNAAKGIKLLGV